MQSYCSCTWSMRLLPRSQQRLSAAQLGRSTPTRIPRVGLDCVWVLSEKESLASLSSNTEAVAEWLVHSQRGLSYWELNVLLLVSVLMFGAILKTRSRTYHSIPRKITFRGWLSSDSNTLFSTIFPRGFVTQSFICPNSKYTMFATGQLLFKG